MHAHKQPTEPIVYEFIDENSHDRQMIELLRQQARLLEQRSCEDVKTVLLSDEIGDAHQHQHD